MAHDTASELLKAERHGVPIAPEVLLPEPPTREQAYAIQDEVLALKVASGEHLIGYKIAVTDAAKMAELGIDEPMFGFLTDIAAVADGGPIPSQLLIAPRIEMEIAFLMERDLGGEHCGPDDVMGATRAVAPALEIIDSRFRVVRYNAMRAIADNVSTCRLVHGAEVPIADAPRNFDAIMYVAGEKAATVAAIRPEAAAAAVAMLVRKLAREGRSLHAGHVVMSGGLAPALPVKRGYDVVASLGGLGTVSCRFT